jgi:bifunctional DNA-binding transcriptional regulator/antitoxin component of YhaV-PrlF toxin-antitoxin module
MLIPFEVADALGVRPGDEITFIVCDSNVRLEKGV